MTWLPKSANGSAVFCGQHVLQEEYSYSENQQPWLQPSGKGRFMVAPRPAA